MSSVGPLRVAHSTAHISRAQEDEGGAARTHIADARDDVGAPTRTLIAEDEGARKSSLMHQGRFSLSLMYPHIIFSHFPGTLIVKRGLWVAYVGALMH